MTADLTRSLVPARATLAAVVIPLLLALTPAAHAFTLSGFVRDQSGAGIESVDLDLYVSLTGQFIFLTDDTTDAAGHYSVVVPAADTYDIVYSKPSGSRFLDLTLADRTLSSNTTIDVVLEAGVYVSGQVQDNLGAPVPSMNMDFEYAGTGVEAPADGDGTNSIGSFATLVGKGWYDVQCKPALATRLVPRQLDNVHVFSDTSLGVITLQQGRLLTGKVLGFDNNPVEGADLDLFVGGVQIFTAGDNTTSSGDFGLSVLPGTYRICIDPPSSTDYAPLLVHDVVVPGDSDVELGEIILPRGWLVTGTVRDAGTNPVANVDLDAYVTSSGIQIATTRDDTDANGAFSLKIPSGTYDLTFDPPVATRLVGRRQGPFTVSADLAIGTITLQSGVLVSGTVLGPGGVPLHRAELDVFPPGGSTEIYVSGARSNAAGFYDVVLLPGEYDLVMNPPPGSSLVPRRHDGFPVLNDRVLNFFMSTTNAVESIPTTPPMVLRTVGAALILELAADVPSLTLDVFDASGRRVRRLWEGSLAAGTRRFPWRQEAGDAPSGIYFARAVAGELRAHARWVVVR